MTRSAYADSISESECFLSAVAGNQAGFPAKYREIHSKPRHILWMTINNSDRLSHILTLIRGIT
jgi:hypothetical protein